MSTIYQVQKNLQTTIAGKEAYLAHIEKDLLTARDRSQIVVLDTMSKFLQININELKVILNDVNTACSEFSLMSWEINPERMGQ